MQAPFQSGDRYDHFRILDVLGDGSFAWVFAAQTDAFEQPVALKLSKLAMVGETMAVRAQREIGILASLNNRHVVHVLDSGVGSDGRWYMVMELLRGRELSALHDFDEPMDPVRAVDIIHQACLGLQEAHRAGIVHRDIKPSNLWVCDDGDIKVIDFGLARSWNDDPVIGANATHGHMLVGTPHYAQPEQVRSGRLTPASDVYSLGFVLYELLTGRVPLFEDERCSEVRRRLDNDPLTWLSAHVEHAIVPLSRYPEGRALPGLLRSAIHAALEREPLARPPHAGALAELLRWALPEALGGWADADVLVLEICDDRTEAPARRLALTRGRHSIGVGRCCDVELAVDALGWVYAEVEWAGPHEAPMLIPVRTDGFVAVGDLTIDRPLRVDPGTIVRLGEHTITLEAARPGS